MTEPLTTERLAEQDPHTWRRPVTATGLLAAFVDAGVIDTPDVHVAQRLCALGEEPDERVALAVALLVRALRGGSVCMDLTRVAEQTGIEAPWPEPAGWAAAVATSPLVAGEPPVLRRYGELLYLDRYWREEEQVCADVRAMTAARPTTARPDTGDLFESPRFDEQRAAAEIALSHRFTVLTGGPGTGKTTTVARLLALLAEQAALEGRPPLRIALAAPTGKAAARLQETVQEQIRELSERDRQRLAGLQATTLHRLLGRRPDSSSRFRHHRGNRLPHDVIVVDETSMVSLTMMARLLEAVRPTARLLLVGDPDQLASVEAGAVLADLVDGLDPQVVAVLRTSHRFGGAIGALADAIRTGDPDATVAALRNGGSEVVWFDTDNPAEVLRKTLTDHAVELRRAALLGDHVAALQKLETHRLLCAHRRGPYGVTHWNRQVERWLTEATGEPIWSAWYPGRPVLVTANDYGLGLYNGDTGVTVRGESGLRVVIAGAGKVSEFAAGRLAEVDTMHAMTIHKSQGSQADEVTVLLPPQDSRLLSRELFYTAVTRAREKVQVVGPEAAVRTAVQRRVVRASGLSRRLRD